MEKFPKHVLSSDQFSPEMIEYLCGQAEDIRAIMETGKKRQLLGKLHGMSMFTVFYEPSTRTRFSFEQAGNVCGMHKCSTENAEITSSVSKGENLEDTVKTLSGYYPDVFVLRHKVKGAAKRAAEVIDEKKKNVHIINAGDGKGEHPSQALLDFYTIWQAKGRKLDNIRIMFGGDLKYGRTVRSLARVLAKYPGITMTFVAPEALQVAEDIRADLDTHQIPYTLESDPMKAFPEADVIYWTRLQKERIEDERTRIELEEIERKGTYNIGSPQLSVMKPTANILHPLPRVGEILHEVDQDPRSWYFTQAENGLYIRIALLLELLRESE